MKTLRSRLLSHPDDDSGISLVEVLVAMLIFAIIAISVASSLVTALAITRENKARGIASNLAASEIDRVRALGDPFAVHYREQVIAVPGEGDYTVKTTFAWVTPGGDVETCGTAGGPLQYKSVTVSVAWPAMRDGVDPVRFDTLLAPSKRINDPTKGTILISVEDAMGIGKPGVTFTVTPSAGLGTISPTDADGCSYILEAPAGTYTVKLTGSGMLDDGRTEGLQRPNPHKTQTVVVGSSTSFAFQYDTNMRYQVNFASNVTGPRPRVPTNLEYTFINSNGTFVTKANGSGSSWYVNMHPYRIGYQAVAGKYVGTTPSCTSVDPESWAPDTRVTPALEGARQTAIPGSPGGSATIDSPMGVVTVAGGGTQRWLTAVSQADVLLPGQPTCAVDASTAMTYDFGQVFPSSGTNTMNVALPFGSWKLFTRNSATGTLVPYTGSLAFVTSGVSAGASGVFALDPR